MKKKNRAAVQKGKEDSKPTLLTHPTPPLAASLKIFIGRNARAVFCRGEYIRCIIAAF